MKSTETIAYFKDRMRELFHMESLDSYRCRYHNILTLIQELEDLIQNWQEGNIKNAVTLIYCIGEIQNLLKYEEIFKFEVCSQKRFREFLDQYKKELENPSEKHSQQGQHLLFLLRKLIDDNRSIYIENLWKAIDSFIYNEREISEKDFTPEMSRLERFTRDLACEILHTGFSKRHAYATVQEYMKLDNSKAAFLKFKNRFSGESRKNYTIILILQLDNVPEAADLSDLKRELDRKDLHELEPEDQKVKKLLQPTRTRRYFISEILAADTSSAIRKAKSTLQRKLDAISLGLSLLDAKILPEAIVIVTDDAGKEYITGASEKPELDGKYSHSTEISDLYMAKLNSIKHCAQIDNSVTLRIDGALRHLRIANCSVESEQQFINYWIALEFIFSSPLVEENTFTRLKINLRNILSASHVERNIRHLEKILRKKGLLKEDENLMVDKIDKITNKDIDLLLLYRLKEHKSIIFGHSDKRKLYFKSYTENLEAHLSRLYRLRNELIHEAAIKENIEYLTSNLKYYLLFLLEQMINYFADRSEYFATNTESKPRKIGMDQFFYEYQIIIDNICEDWSLERFRNVPLHQTLIE